MKLYVVSTYYHALIACIKQLNCSQIANIFVLSDIPNGQSLTNRIKKSGLFCNAVFVGEIAEYKAKNRLDYILNFHRRNLEQIEKQLDFSFVDYDEIDLFHDDTWVARYLKDKQIRYRLVEDALDVYKKISKTAFTYMTDKSPLKLTIKRLLHIGYLYCGADPSTVCVEVNDIDGIEIARLAGDKLVEVPRGPMFAALTPGDVIILKGIFGKDIPELEPERSILLLTQPLFLDGLASSQQEQENIYLDLVSKNLLDCETLVVKPHPRDFMNYAKIFPTAIILDKDMPVELLGLMGISVFKKVLSFSSTAGLSPA